MIKIIPRYLSVTFIPPFLLGLLFFVLFLLTTQMFKVIRLVVAKDVDSFVIFELMFNISISFIPLAVPIAIFFATIYSVGKLSEDSEIIAMRSFGLGKFRLLLPFITVAFFVGLTTFFLNWNVVPKSNEKFTNKIIQLTSKGILNNIRPGEFFTQIPNVTLFSEQVLDEGKRLKNIFIQITNKSKTETKVIMAEEGLLIKKGGEDQGSFINLVLLNGNIITSFKNSSDLDKILFERYDFPLFSSKSIPTSLSRSTMFDSSALYKKITVHRNKLNKVKKAKKISKRERRIKNILRTMNRDLMEFWTRINTPILCLIFVLLGFSLGIKGGRSEEKSGTVIGIFILIFYYVLFFFGISLIKKYYINPVGIIFAPTMMMLLIGSYFYSRVDWNN